MIRVAIIGYGYSAVTFHIPLLHACDDFAIEAVVSSKPSVVKEALPTVTCYQTLETLLEDESIELVVITSPNAMHYDMARKTIEAGRHVVLEKPFVTSVREGESLIALADEAGVLLTVFQNRRWDGDFLTVKSLIEQQRFGKIRYFESHFDRFRPNVRQRWREQPGTGAGIWYDLGAHLVDQALILFGQPESISSSCRALRDGSTVDDYFHVVFHYSECEVILHSSPFCASPGMRFQVQSDKGNYIKYGLDPQENALKAKIQPGSQEWNNAIQEEGGTFYTADGQESVSPLAGNYMAFYNNLNAAITHGKPLEVTASEALEVIKIIEDVQRLSRL